MHVQLAAMADQKEQAKPLAPSSSLSSSSALQFHCNIEEDALSEQLKLRQRKYIKCCGCIAAVFLIQAVIVLVLVFTVFDVKNPVIRMNNITVQHLEFANGGPGLNTSVNVTLLADISVKNPNMASYKFQEGTNTVYYGGTVVGEGRVPGGNAKARRTVRMNVTTELMPQKILSVPSLAEDTSSGALTMSSDTVIGGKVKILSLIKKHLVVRMNCTMTYNITSHLIQGLNCRPHLTSSYGDQPYGTSVITPTSWSTMCT